MNIGKVWPAKKTVNPLFSIRGWELEYFTHKKVTILDLSVQKLREGIKRTLQRSGV